MTVPGPKPDQPGYGGNATWTNPYGTWETRRVPDAVRVAALANAVDLYGPLPDDCDLDLSTEQVVKIARTFEAYLTGEEADGTT
jgi:hypothetical protein